MKERKCVREREREREKKRKKKKALPIDLSLFSKTGIERKERRRINL